MVCVDASGGSDRLISPTSAITGCNSSSFIVSNVCVAQPVKNREQHNNTHHFFT
jgi:hypothetical protein